MGLLDDLKKVAKDAAKAIEDAGVVDDVVDAVKDAASTASGSSEASDSAETVPDRVVPPEGVIDPAALLTLDDINEITGLGFDHTYPYEDEEWIGTTLTFESPAKQDYFELRVARAPLGEPFDPNDRWEFLTTEVSPQEPVVGITEGAFRSSDDVIFFRAGDQVMHTMASFGGNPRTAEWCVALASRAASRVSS